MKKNHEEIQKEFLNKRSMLMKYELAVSMQPFDPFVDLRLLFISHFFLL